MKRPIYNIFNVIYEIVALWCLVFANTFLNDLLIPTGLMRKGGGRRMDTGGLLAYAGLKTLIVVVEAAILIIVFYAINQAVLSDTESRVDRNIIAGRTARWHMIITGCFIIILMWGSFKGYLW